ncbi:MAG: hypothetical protein JJU20_07760 [Opitutales bacterium]|nr:hypothetical protein [Opitutales bacterium]
MANFYNPLVLLFVIGCTFAEAVPSLRLSVQDDGLYKRAIVLDGGSYSLFFDCEEGGEKVLYLDRSFLPRKEFDEDGNPVGRAERTKDGHSYWGDEAFDRRVPLDPNSELGKHLESELRNWLKQNKGAYPDDEVSILMKVLQAFEKHRGEG